MNPIVSELVELLDEVHFELWEERAAIMEFDAGLSRDHAECLALLDVIRNDPAALLSSYNEYNLLNKGAPHGK